jgi:hypothetical protein
MRRGGKGLKRYCSVVKEADKGEGADGELTRGCEEVGEGMRRTWRCED